MTPPHSRRCSRRPLLVGDRRQPQPGGLLAIGVEDDEAAAIDASGGGIAAMHGDCEVLRPRPPVGDDGVVAANGLAVQGRSWTSTETSGQSGARGWRDPRPRMRQGGLGLALQRSERDSPLNSLKI
jgi:hypothetical protein